MQDEIDYKRQINLYSAFITWVFLKTGSYPDKLTDDEVKSLIIDYLHESEFFLRDHYGCDD